LYLTGSMPVHNRSCHYRNQSNTHTHAHTHAHTSDGRESWPWWSAEWPRRVIHRSHRLRCPPTYRHNVQHVYCTLQHVKPICRAHSQVLGWNIIASFGNSGRVIGRVEAVHMFASVTSSNICIWGRGRMHSRVTPSGHQGSVCVIIGWMMTTPTSVWCNSATRWRKCVCFYMETKVYFYGQNWKFVIFKVN